MNKTFRIVWSAVRNAFVVTHEWAKAHGKPSSLRRGAVSALIAGLLAGSGFVLAAPAANTLPTGGQIVGGATAGNIATSGTAMTVTQNQQRMVANWNTFSVGSAASVNFQQPSGGVALNRVTGTQPSEIYGKLTATGDVYLVNPNGVLFGRTAQVDVGGLVATTQAISDADFMAGKAKFARNGSTGKVENEGQITAGLGGYVALLAPEVRNSGVIVAQMGTVVLAAGEAVELQFDSGRLANVRVDPATVATLVENKNAVLAPGGLIILSAQAASKLQGAAIKNSGTLDASSLTTKGGRIVLEASTSVENTGTITAAGSATHAGGNIEITAPQVVQNGTLDVSGSTGGSVSIKASDSFTLSGQILAKGLADKGGSIQITQAQSVALQTGSRIDASGNTQGGSVYAESANAIKAEGSVDASSTNGSGGDITLVAGTEVAASNATLDASGATQGGTIRLSAKTATHTSLADPLNPINDPTAPPSEPPKVAVTGTTVLRTGSSRGRGGKIELTADDILLGTGTLLDATGATGGGDVLVGGDWQGSNGVYQATTVAMETGAAIDASATQNGNGGKVVLWADVNNTASKTTAGGTILAKGGTEGGDGGKIETSAAMVDIGSMAIFNTLAPKGTTGWWLLDPYDYVIGASQAANIVSGLSTSNVAIQTAVNTASYGSSGNSANTGNIAVNAVIDARTGVLSKLALTNGGSGYLTAPTVTISGGGGTGATATATISGGVVTGINITSTGTGYTSTPTVSFSGGSGTGAAATATALLPGQLAAISVGNGGSGYSVAPTVTISGGGGTGATATAIISGGIVTGINIISVGSGYITAPTITLSGGSGTGATATGTIPLPSSTTLSMTAAGKIAIAADIIVGSLNLAGTGAGSSTSTGVELAATITTSGAQTYTGKLALAGNTVLNSTTGGITFNDAVNALGGTELLTGTSSWLIPSNITTVDAWAIGAGGGGGASQSGAGGGAGGVAYRQFTTTPGQSISYSTGTAGSGAGGTNGSGTAGGTTTLTYASAGVSLTANGGGGGNSASSGGAGGTATGGTVNVTGGNGGLGTGGDQTSGAGGGIGGGNGTNGGSNGFGPAGGTSLDVAGLADALKLVGKTLGVGGPGGTTSSNIAAESGNTSAINFGAGGGGQSWYGSVTRPNGLYGGGGGGAGGEGSVGNAGNGGTGVVVLKYATSASSLSINAGSGDVWFKGKVGDSANPSGLTINTTGKLSFDNTVSTGTLTASTGGNITFSGADSTSNGIVVAGVKVGGAVNLTTLTGSLSLAGTLDAGANVITANIGGSATFAQGLTGTGGINLTSNALTISSGTVYSGSQAINITTDALTLGGATRLLSSGALTIKPKTASTTIGLGGATGTLQLPTSYFSTNLATGVAAISVTAAGTSYTSAPTVTFSGGGGSGATATANISGGQVVSITITNPGTGYTSAPTISFSGGGGSGAAATATFARFSDITIGSATTSGKITAGTISPASNLILQNTTGGIEITGAVNTGTNNLTLNSTGAVTDSGSGAISAAGLALLGGGTVTLDSTSNAIITLAANTGRVTLLESNGFTVGTVGSTVGVTSTGPIDLATRSGDLAITQNISTSDTSSSAIVLNAGKDTSVGTTTGGNVTRSGSQTVTTGSGGRATIFTGSVTSSTNITSLVGSGSGNFRYNSDEASSGYDTVGAALGTGLYALYREKPTVSFTIANASMVYGDTTPGLPLTISSGVNGDTVDQIFKTSPTLTIGGTKSSSGNWTVGSHSLSATGGTDRLGYTLGSITGLGTLTVTKRTVTLTGDTLTKTYDGTASMQSGQTGYGALSNLVSGDTVTTTGSAVWSAASAGARTINQGTTAITGTDAGNYQLSWVNGSGTINKASLTMTAQNTSKLVGQADPSYTYTLTGFVNGETAASAGITGASVSRTGSETAAGTYTGVLAPTFTTNSNYVLNPVSGNLTIVPADTLLIKLADSSNVYGNTLPTLTASSAQYIAAGNVLRNVTLTATGGGNYTYSDGLGTTGSFTVTTTASSTSSVGNYTVSLSNFTQSGSNFSSQSTQSAALTVTQRAVSTGSASISKVYDGTTYASGSIGISNLVGTDAVTLTGIGTFSDKNVGSSNKSYTLSSLTLSGAASSNYYLTSGSFTGSNGTITQRALTWSVDNSSSTYGTVATAGNARLFNTVAGDTIAATVTVYQQGTSTTVTPALRTAAGAYDEKVTALTGSDAGNYSLGSGTTGTLTIAPKAIVFSAPSISKTYDGTASYSTTAQNLTDAAAAAGVVSGDTLTGLTLAFSDKNAATNKAVTAASATFSGSQASNYTISYQTANTGTISPLSISINGTPTAANKTYDGLTDTSVSGGTLSGVLAADTASVSLVKTGTFTDANAGNSKTVNLVYGLSGSEAGNYVLASTTGTTTANIAKANLTMTANNDAKLYLESDPTFSASYSGFVNGETDAVLSNVAITRSNAGTEGAVTYAGVLVPSATSGNYNITTNSGTFSILPAQTLLIQIGNKSKVYGDAIPDFSTGIVYSARYLTAGDVVQYVPITASGSNIYSGNDGHGTTFSFTVGTTASSTSNVGSYAITSSAFSQTGSNFNTQVTQDGTLTITPRAVSVAISGQSKVYDGSTAMAGLALSVANKIGADDVTLAGTSTYLDKNAGTGKSYAVESITLGGTAAANYYLTGYTVSGADGVITPRTLNVSYTGVNKVYDGTTQASVTTGDDRVTGDVLAIQRTAAFLDKNVATGKTIDVTGVYLAGTDSGNYSVSTTGGTTANITQRTLNAAYYGNSKIYDGTVAATFTSSDDRVTGDVFTLTGSAAFADKNAGTNKTIAITGASLSGTDSGNYSLVATGSTTANIGQKALSVTAPTVTRIYDGTTTTGAAATISALAAGDSIDSAAIVSFLDKNVGTGKAVRASGLTVKDGSNANMTGNYMITYVDDNTGSITPKALTISGLSSQNKVYDGTTAATVNGSAALQTKITVGTGNSSDGKAYTGDSINLSGTAIGTFNDKDVADATTVSFSGLGLSGADAGNYTLTAHASVSNTITPKALTISGLSSQNKVYDGTTTATVNGSAAMQSTIAAGTGSSSDGKAYTGDAISISGTAVGSFNDRDVADATTVSFSGLGLSGADAANYSLTPHASASYSITPKALTISGITAANKVYDGNAVAAVSTAGVVETGLVAGDVVNVATTGLFNDKNVANGKTVTLSSSYTGTDVGNYTITDQATTSANVTPKALTISGITASNKIYDGNAVAAISTTGVVETGLVVGDTVTVSSTGLFNDKNVANGKTVTLTSSYTGTDVGNYTITDQATTSANVTPKALTISGITASNKVYDGNAVAAVSTAGVLETGLVAGDTVTVTTTGLFNDKNVANSKTVTLSSSYTGTDVGNYTITDQATTTANVTPKALTISGITASNKIYDGNAVSAVSTGGVVETGLVAGDTVTVATTGLFNDKNVANGKTVTLSSSYTGTDVGNYTITDQATTSANVTPKALTISGITAANKIYDGNAVAAISTTGVVETGLVAGDTVTVATTGLFNDKNVANGKTVTLSSSYTGTDVGNYTITDQATTSANVTPKALTISGITAANKVYDGNAVAAVSTAGVVETGLVAGDEVNVAATGLFNDKKVANGKTVTLSSSYTGTDVGNYTITDQATTSANVTQKALTISGITAANKVYDGNAVASVSTAGVTATALQTGGMVAGDDITVSATGNFRNATNTANDKNAGNSKTVLLSSTYGGTDLGNYTVTDQATTTADITPKTLTISNVTAADKTYNSTTAADVTLGSLVGLVGSETLVVNGVGNFSDANVGFSKTVQVALTLADATGLASNYAISNTTTTASINPVPNQVAPLPPSVPPTPPAPPEVPVPSATPLPTEAPLAGGTTTSSGVSTAGSTPTTGDSPSTGGTSPTGNAPSSTGDSTSGGTTGGSSPATGATGTSTTGSESTGGSTTTGGAPATGGTSTAGDPTVGGSTTTAGTPASGDSSPAGGVSSAGGTPTAGGESTSGGTTTAGGVPATGGTATTGDPTAGGSTTTSTASSGGSSPAGGISSAGGTPTTGGESTGGGTTTAGGIPATGGTSTAGDPTVGGNTTTAGTPASGGSSPAGGVSSAGGTQTTGGESTGGTTTAGGVPATGGTATAGDPTAGGSTTTSTASSGGSSPTGGVSSAGDTPTSGGESTGGGTTTAGGVPAAGGTTLVGESSVGGTTATTGTSASGGSSPVGGVSSAGGESTSESPTTGGAPATGGTSTAGDPTVGGSTTTGTPASGGSSPAGGVSSAGSTPTAGGESTSGGTTTAGGIPATGGTATTGDPTVGGNTTTTTTPASGGSSPTSSVSSTGGTPTAGEPTAGGSATGGGITTTSGTPASSTPAAEGTTTTGSNSIPESSALAGGTSTIGSTPVSGNESASDGTPMSGATSTTGSAATMGSATAAQTSTTGGDSAASGTPVSGSVATTGGASPAGNAPVMTGELSTGGALSQAAEPPSGTAIGSGITGSSTPAQLNLTSGGQTSLSGSSSTTTTSGQGASGKAGGNFIGVRSFNDLNVAASSLFSFTIPKDTFKHSNAKAVVTLSAKGADGNPLPDWLSFDPLTGRFFGRPPMQQDQFVVTVTATDTAGNVASTRIVLKLNPGN